MVIVPSLKETARRFKESFGDGVTIDGPLASSGAGLRIEGLDLAENLNPQQVECLIDTLAYYRIICIPNQTQPRFDLNHLERFANHWGAPIPHPSNFLRDGKPAQGDGASEGELQFIPLEERAIQSVNKTFPGQLQVLDHTSPAVLIVSNFRGTLDTKTPKPTKVLRVARGGSWHTDIEYEPEPLTVSMFLVHKMPINRESPSQTWVHDPELVEPHIGPYFEGSSELLMKRRKKLPLNGETAFVDTAAAYDALDKKQQQILDRTHVRRRLNTGDTGWLAPLVRIHPRSQIKSLHSPIWASRPRVRPPIEIDGMNAQDSRLFLDEIETHILKSEFRYDHIHQTGDVTIWDNHMTLHNSPPMQINIKSIADARLLYRISVKGTPSLTLPREDHPDWLAKHVTNSYKTDNELLTNQ